MGDELGASSSTDPCLGTTHADYFRGAVPALATDTPGDGGAYEKETGRVIVETFEALDPDEIPAVLVASHGSSRGT